LFNWLVAKKYGGQFLLRIEDTDKARSTDESTKAIFEGLNWLNLKWDEKVVYQGANKENHAKLARGLAKLGYAYKCFCSQEELNAQRAAMEAEGKVWTYPRTCANHSKNDEDRLLKEGRPYVIRFRVPDEGETGWDDLIHGRISFPNKDLGGDFIILRSDGTPIYNLAVVHDDVEMNVNVILRGDDHIPNTPKQILLYEAIKAAQPAGSKFENMALPQFGHMPMIFGSDGKKLSKRHGATAVGDYKGFGIVPDVMINFLSLLGWSPGEDREIMTVEEIIEAFTIEKMTAKAAVFDMKKLEWMNGQYIQKLPDTQLVSYLQETVGQARGTDWWLMVVRMLKPRVRTLVQLQDMARLYAFGFPHLDEKAVAKQWPDNYVPEAIEQLTKFYDKLSGKEVLFKWNPEQLTKVVNEAAGEDKKAFQSLRLALVGKLESPPLGDVLCVLGPDGLSRIHYARANLQKRING
jgi:glutamyl-tRNA synthetase